MNQSSFDYCIEQDNFLFSETPRWSLESIQFPITWMPAALSPRHKAMQPSGAKIKWSWSSSPPQAFAEWIGATLWSTEGRTLRKGTSSNTHKSWSMCSQIGNIHADLVSYEQAPAGHSASHHHVASMKRRMARSRTRNSRGGWIYIWKRCRGRTWKWNPKHVTSKAVDVCLRACAPDELHGTGVFLRSQQSLLGWTRNSQELLGPSALRCSHNPKIPSPQLH